MLRLKEIKRNNSIISAYYDPEDSGELGYVEVSVKTGEEVKVEPSHFEGTIRTYMRHAISALSQMAKMENLPEEKTVMWY